MNDKEILRKEFINIRKNIENKKEKSYEIFKRVINLDEYKNSNTIALYKNLDNEVNTDNLIDYSLSNGKIVTLPRVVGNNLVFYIIKSIDDNLERSSFGILEPLEDKNNIIDNFKIDLVIVPGVCFDTLKNRIGFGKGFYDRFLEESKAYGIAICFEEQVLKNRIIPKEENDVKVKKIVTDKKIY